MIFSAVVGFGTSAWNALFGGSIVDDGGFLPSGRRHNSRFVCGQVDMLCGVMSDKEYLVIIDCASTNVSEPPNLPPSFRDNAGASETSNQEFMNLESPQQDSDEPVAQVPGSDGQTLTSWTKMRWNIDVRHVELELYVGVDRDSPLARLEVLLNSLTTMPLVLRAVMESPLDRTFPSFICMSYAISKAF